MWKSTGRHTSRYNNIIIQYSSRGKILMRLSVPRSPETVVRRTCGGRTRIPLPVQWDIRRRETNAKSHGEIYQDVFVERLLTGGRRVQLRQSEVHVLLVGRHRQYLIETLHQLVEHGPLIRMVTPTVPHYHVSVMEHTRSTTELITIFR